MRAGHIGDAMRRTEAAYGRPCRKLRFFAVSLCALAFAGPLSFALPPPEQHTQQRGTTANDADPSEARTCAPCHSALVAGFAEGRHASHSKAKAVSCATCHGAQKDHVASGGTPTKEPDASMGTQEQVDALCLSCHQGKHANFDRSIHAKRGLSCTTCHSIHAAGREAHLLKTAELQLCYHCHADVKPQFQMPSRHNVEEGLIECTDCHDPHGTAQEERPGAHHRQDSFCTNCHTAMEGPFRFEHPIVKTEGCTACHLPHGGPNPHLLLKASVDAICQFCHFPSPDPASGAHMPAAPDAASPHKACTDCHADVHGSSSSLVFLKTE